MIVFVWLSTTGYAQTNEIDSLEQLLKRSDLPDQDRVDVMTDLSFKYHRSDISKGLEYANEALRIATKINYRKGVGDAYHKIGVNLWEKGSLDSSLVAYEEAILVYDELGLVEAGVRARMNKAIIFENKDELSKALVHYEKALALIEEHQIENMGGVVSYNMGLVYNKMGNWNAAIERYFKLIEHAENVGNHAWQGSGWQSIGNAYINLKDNQQAKDAFRNALRLATSQGYKRQEADARRGLGRVLIEENQLDSAKGYFESALEIQSSLGRKTGIALNLKSLGEISQKRGQYEEALKYQTQVAEIYEELQRPLAIAMALVRIGETRLLMDDLSSSESYLIRGYEMLKDYNSLTQLYVTTELLAELYGKKGVYDKAYAFQRLHSVYQDSLLNDNKLKEIGQLEAQFQFEQEKQQLLFDQERERLQLEQENELIRVQMLSVAGGLILLVIASVFIIRAYRSKDRANQKLQQLDQFKTRFFANINHDFRTPLTLMQGYIHRLSTNEDDYLTTQSRSDLENLSNNTITLKEMTNEIQNLILLEEGKLHLKFRAVDLKDYLHRQVLMFESMAEMSGIDLKFESQLKKLEIHLDTSHFEKILFNLISNAFRFTPEGGNITVQIQEAKEAAIIEVSDTGKGIAQEDLPNIFDRFYQSPLNEYRSKEGFGIGLAVVRELVELHGGSISAKSQIDQGTIFTITLPLNLDKPVSEDEEIVSEDHIEAIPTKPARNSMVSSDGTQSSVLVVDDHEEVREYISSLVAETYDVKQAANGKQALELLKNEKVDLIITDLMMPWLDGYGLIDELQKDDSLKTIPVMVVSARTTEEDKHRVLDAGVNEFISKPFDPELFQKRIRNMIADNSDNNVWESVIADQDLQSNLEDNILKKLNHIIVDQISDSGLTIQVIADELSASRSKAIRLVKELTGQTPLEYIKRIRMDFIQQAIRAGKIKNASEAATSIGMSNSTQFTNQYKKYFGEHPFKTS